MSPTTSRLEDGIYTVITDGGLYRIRFVHDGLHDILWPFVGRGCALPEDTSDWVRVADLPTIPVTTEPTQVGYPVMAGCVSDDRPHLHIRRMGEWNPWWCTNSYITWSHLIDPRDLSDDEIAGYNLWTGPVR